jgi:hypothetical protein
MLDAYAYHVLYALYLVHTYVLHIFGFTITSGSELSPG